ncbi:DUF305 domain-containing protein [Rhodococcus sp. ABRD24]|uniref:DUF305 domain-containing protein n=1 Tax=Rhodococcus sp. ABRD24 TaxID=2507582 RepID=UPI00103A7EE7|nr:DUF305 domain-containing protein [Rhodococcus sp. ABRD24]QBJ97954.1 DUF305 domain-containing protein [Rhodococcus sp. ABRD24]
MTAPETDAEQSTASATSKRSQRTALAVIGLIGAIAIGFALGFFARLPIDDREPAHPGADSVDVGFSQDMTVHHNQAIDMATITLTRSGDRKVKDLAFDILTSQQNQVGQMQGWLALWDRAPLPTEGYMTWMTEGDGGHSGHGAATTAAPAQPNAGKMPGMATAEEMAALGQASGSALDVMFLQLMLRHHQGGLPMIEYAKQYADVPVVRNLAQKMMSTQQGESTLITSMLAERGVSPLPMN